MPAGRVNQTIYIGPHASIEQMNDAALYKPGELGGHFRSVDNKEYQLVQLDSGATAATSVGVVAAGQLAYWKDRASYLVTNDSAQALGGQAANSNFRNFVAGMFTAAVTANYFGVVQQRGTGNVKAASGGTWSPGNKAVANTGTVADATTATAGTAPGTDPIGSVVGARDSGTGKALVDLTVLPEVP